MQIHKAAQRALEEIDKPTHLRELVQYIEQHGYFSFGAQSPERALGVALDRRSKGTAVSRASAEQLFYRSAPATYGLLAWLSEERQRDLDLDELIDAAAHEEHSLDTSLILEQELQEWLYKNLQHNGLIALGYGPLTLFDADKQAPLAGKYRTTTAGEIDMLLRTEQGDLLVLELKRKSTDSTVGQVCRYVGWTMEHLVTSKETKVFGLILARQINEPLRLAIKATHSRIRYCTLELDAVLGKPCR